jgi:quercetin dioxygenase-like cupin family protein
VIGIGFSSTVYARYDGTRPSVTVELVRRQATTLSFSGKKREKRAAAADARATGMANEKLIEHVSEIAAYSPPAHHGTVNRRLVAREFGAGFEMILGRVAPGGAASRHYHVDEMQIVYILQGEAEIALGDDAPRRCGPGTVIRIPPGLTHEVVTVGEETVQLIVLYAPPLGAHAFVEVPR